MACARNIGLTDIPIVCVNVDGYYDHFRHMLQRSYEDELIKLQPHEVLHFEPTAEAAVRWLEDQAAQAKTDRPKLRTRKSILTRTSMLGRSSFMGMSYVGGLISGRSSRWEDGKLVESSWSIPGWALTFAAGLAAGVVVTSQLNRFKA
jgi:hypothetical protein